MMTSDQAFEVIRNLRRLWNVSKIGMETRGIFRVANEWPP
jgi:hypothetical protein